MGTRCGCPTARCDELSCFMEVGMLSSKVVMTIGSDENGERSREDKGGNGAHVGVGQRTKV